MGILVDVQIWVDRRGNRELRRYNCADREGYRLFDPFSQQQLLKTAKSKIIREMNRMGKKMTY